MDTMKELVHGKAVVRARLAGFLIPLHAFAEIGGVSVSSQSRPITHDEFCGEGRGNGLRLDPECRSTRRHRIRLTNSFGLGGTNAYLVFCRLS
jgi:hypothetical protein